MSATLKHIVDVLLSYKLTKVCIIVSVGNTKVTITGTNLADIKEAKIGDVVCTKVDNCLITTLLTIGLSFLHLF